jgi:hypothetical protein
MRRYLLSLAALPLLLPATVWAADDCPNKATPEVLAGLGEPAGTLDASQTVYRPSGLTMLGLPVSYVVVSKVSGKDDVEEIDYRFDGVMRKYSERYPKAVLQAFDKAYSGASCSSGRVTSCSIAFDNKSPGPGQLSGVAIGEGSVSAPDKAEGEALAAVKADFASDDAGPVFLVCLYGS